MNFTICPNCKMRVLPKADGTCPSCQAILPQIKPPSESIEPPKSSAAASPRVKKKTTNDMDKPGKSVSAYRQAVLLDPDKNDVRENTAKAAPMQAAAAHHQTVEKKQVKMNETLKMILWALAAGFLYGAYKTVVSIFNK